MSSLEQQIGALAEAAFQATEPVVTPGQMASRRRSTGLLAVAATVVLAVAVAAVILSRGTVEEVTLAVDFVPSDAVEVVVEIAEEPTLIAVLPLLDRVDGFQELTVPGVAPFVVGEITDLEGFDMGTYEGDAQVICTARAGPGPPDGGDAHATCGPNEPNGPPTRSGELIWTGDGRSVDAAIWLVPEGTDQVVFTMSGRAFRQSVAGEYAVFALVDPCVPYSESDGCDAYRMVAFDEEGNAIAVVDATADPTS